MARDSSTVKVSFLGDASQLAREARRADQSMDAVGRRASDMGAKMGKAFALGASAAATGAVVLAKGAIDAASDLNESLSKNQAVFGKSADVVKAWADNSQKNILLTKQAAIEGAATFGNLFVALGLGQKPAAELSTSLVGLAGDLSSFNNVDTGTALNALKSGLLGEAEPLRAFGVSLSAARIEAEALAIGLVKPVANMDKIRTANLKVADATERLAKVQQTHGKGTLAEAKAQDDLTRAQSDLSKVTAGQVGELTAAEKAQAAYSIILKDTKTAQGDAARTADGYANSTRILQKQLGDINAEIGQKLLPYVLEATQYVSGLITEFENGTGTGGQLRDALGGVADAAQAVADVVVPVVEFMADHPDEFKTAAVGVGIYAAAMKAAAMWTSAMAAIDLMKVAAGMKAIGAAGAVGPAGGGKGAKLKTAAKGAGTVGVVYAVADAIKGYLPGEDTTVGEVYDAYTGLGTWPGRGPTGPGRSGDDGRPRLTPMPRSGDDNRRPLGFVPTAKKPVDPFAAAIAEQARQQEAAVKQAKYAADQAEAIRKRETDRLAAEAERREKIARRIEAATDKVREALQRRADISGRVRDTLLSNASIVQGGMSWTAGDLAAAFRKKMLQVQKFQQAISAMVHKGFDATIIQQVAEGGVENMQTAVGLAGATSAQVKQINATQAAIDKAAGNTGDRVAKGVYGGNITIPIDVYLDGKKLAPDVARAVNEWNRKAANNGSRSARAA